MAENVKKNQPAKEEPPESTEALRKRIAALEQELELSRPPRKSPAAPDRGDELVDYMAPRFVRGDERPIFVGVNGENIRIQRGVPVRIKRKFLEALANAQTQEYAAYQAIRAAQEQGKKALAEL